MTGAAEQSIVDQWRSDRAVVGGVAAALAGNTEIPAPIIRAAFAVLVLTNGAGFALYLGLWLLLPRLNRTKPITAPVHRTIDVPVVDVLGGGLVACAVALVVASVDDLYAQAFAITGCIFTGVWLLNRRPQGPAPALPTEPIKPTEPIEPFLSIDQTEPMPKPRPAPANSTDDTTVLLPPAPSRPDPQPAVPDDLADSMIDPGSMRRHWAVPKTVEETTLAERRPEPGPPLATLAFLGTMAALGIALVLNTVADVFVSAATVVGAGLAMTGLAMSVSAFRGRTLPLVPLALVLGALLPVTPGIDHAVRDGVGSVDVDIDDPTEARRGYGVGVGDLTIDLTGIDPDDLSEDLFVSADVGVGHLQVWVPPGVPVHVRASTWVGGLYVLERWEEGLRPTIELRSPPDGGDAPSIVLFLDNTYGNIEVTEVTEVRELEQVEE
jgi:phage shock protein PspC (stress-responsive transcriptional regulator)